uniref:Uncharacterized protein n=1 Tax=Oryza rufipogon TaxID=4529 RepID=A0A0E0RFJ0_ORYRU
MATTGKERDTSANAPRREKKGVAAPHHTKPVARCIVSTVARRQAFMVTLRAARSMAMHRLQGLFPPQHLDAPPFIPSRHQPSCLMSRVPAIATGCTTTCGHPLHTHRRHGHGLSRFAPHYLLYTSCGLATAITESR